MTLRDSIHQLTRPHLKTGPDNRPRHVPALLAELRAAVTPGRTNGGGGGTGGAPIPINPNALDLLQEIEAAARQDYLAWLGNPWAGNLEELLQQLAIPGIPDDWETYFQHVTLDWVDRINALLWPTKPRRKLYGKTCPACGQALHGQDRNVCLTLGCWDAEGNLAPLGDWVITCEACQAQWAGDQVAWLLNALDTPEPKREYA